MKSTVPISAVLRQKGHKVYALPPNASVYSAVELMALRSAGALLVMEGETITGIVSERDYARKVILLGKSSRETPIRDIMTSPVYTVTPSDNIADVMRLMTERRIRHVPVVENEYVVGVVSIGDLVKWIVTEQEQTIEELHSYIAGSYPR
ncbi:MAG: CBS domain-containing protein [Candidatus Solibacter usitatus]|nr:CBS domain-containing protein [Candidatus Solibacter usitatus]